jgi:hypothetical protein
VGTLMIRVKHKRLEITPLGSKFMVVSHKGEIHSVPLAFNSAFDLLFFLETFYPREIVDKVRDWIKREGLDKDTANAKEKELRRFLEGLSPAKRKEVILLTFLFDVIEKTLENDERMKILRRKVVQTARDVKRKYGKKKERANAPSPK